MSLYTKNLQNKGMAHTYVHNEPWKNFTICIHICTSW